LFVQITGESGLGPDIAIENGLVVDGTGNPWYQANLAVKNGRIATISPLPIKDARQTIDAKGLIVSPGFIDMHSHSDFALLAGAQAESKIRQGVTTEVIGNCGVSAAPLEGEAVDFASHGFTGSAADLGIKITWSSLADYMARLDRQGSVVNVACLIGHGTVRTCVMGLQNRPPSTREMGRMKQLVAKCMREGAFGMSSGLLYVPGCYAKLDELVELGRTVARFGGIYSSHIRDESENLERAVNEVLAVGSRSGVAVQISHHKACGKSNWGKVKATLPRILRARAAGVDVTVDVYPYTAYCTWLSAAVPPWAHEGGIQRLITRLKDPAIRRKLKAQMKNGFPNWESMTKGGKDWNRFLISAFPIRPRLIGRTLQQISESRKCDPYDAIFDLLIEGEGSADVVVEDMCEEDVETVLQSHVSMIGSDGNSLSTTGPLGMGQPHPRSFGTFPRVLARYVRQRGALRLEEAIRKMTSFPANKLGLSDRGLLREGMVADLVIFDPSRIADMADYLEPRQFPRGICYVLVNGKITIAGSKNLRKLHGHVLRKALR
jgi:N-acyl-D-amino-acid deacylase